MARTWRSPQVASQVSRLKPTGLLCVGMEERTGLQCEGGNARCIACLVAFWMRQTAPETVSGSCNEQLAQFTTERQPLLRPAVSFSKNSFKHRSIQSKGNFTKVTLHLYLNCIMYCAGLLFCSVYCELSLPSLLTFKRS
jgi:hypothetical protein